MIRKRIQAGFALFALITAVSITPFRSFDWLQAPIDVPIAIAGESVTAYAWDGTGMSPVESTIYDGLKAQIVEVAAGKRSSTKFSLQTNYSSTELANADMNLIITHLLGDCPFDLFWHDKTRTVENGEGKDGVYCQYQQDGSIEFDFKVATAYRSDPSDLFSVNTGAIARGETARAMAQCIVSDYAGKSDYEKLKAYRDIICNMVDYDHAAAASPVYGDGHQLIYAFDSNPNTNVVCEGYAKAFKYLCDLSTFEHDIHCYLISGISDAGNGAGDHMWNLIRIGNESYLVDITNCDNGTIGADYELFLKTAISGSVDGGYTFSCYGRDLITYYYDASMKGAYGADVLTLIHNSHSALDAIKPTAPNPAPIVPNPTPAETKPIEVKPEQIEENQESKSVTLSFVDTDVQKTYGDAPFELKASGASEGQSVTYTSSDPQIATVTEGTVQIRKPGTVTITAECEGSKASYQLVIGKRNLSWDVSGLYAADPGNGWDAILTGELAISGILDEDKTNDSSFVFDSSDLSGIYSGQKVVLNWKEGKQWKLTGSKADYYQLPELLPELEGRLVPSQVLATPPESTDETPLELTMESQLVTVPEALLTNTNLNTPKKIEAVMEDSLETYDGQQICHVGLRFEDESGNWVDANADTFPDEGVTITIPYPEGTSMTEQDFVICHMFGEDVDGHAAGELEYPDVVETADGLQFKVYSLSPIAIGWRNATGTVTESMTSQFEEPMDLMSIQEIIISFGLGIALLVFAGGLAMKSRRG